MVRLEKKEKKEKNNHAVWYDVQTGFIAAHIGNMKLVDDTVEASISARIEAQITTDGQLPQELARVNSWSYNEFCIDAFFHLGILATWTPTNLWTAANSRIRTALDWQLPYIELEKQWPAQQVLPFISNCTIEPDSQCIGSYFDVLRIAANVYNNSTYEDQICKLPGIDCLNNVLNLEYEKNQN